MNKKKENPRIGYCQECGQFSTGLNIHHINRDHEDNDELNLIALCVECHKLEHKERSVFDTVVLIGNNQYNKRIQEGFELMNRD